MSGEGLPGSVDQLDLDAEAAELAASLESDGVKMCESCGLRPVRPRKSATGRAPTTCQVCAAKKGRGGKKEAAPTNVRISFGSGRKAKSSDAELVETKAKAAALMIATGLTLMGQNNDGKILADGAEQWARAVGGLAPYEPWLVKLCQGGEISGRAMAWATAGVATAGIVVPCLMAHGVALGPLEKMFESVGALAAQAAEEAAAHPEAA